MGGKRFIEPAIGIVIEGAARKGIAVMVGKLQCSQTLAMKLIDAGPLVGLAIFFNAICALDLEENRSAIALTRQLDIASS